MEIKIALEFFVLILLAKLGEEISVRLRQPSLIGQLIMGILLGMVARKIGLHEEESVRTFANFGVWLLLFLAGLEMNLAMIRSLGPAAAVVAVAGVAVPMAGGVACGLVAGLGIMPSLVIGTALVATSVGVSVEILRELKVLRSRLGMFIVSTAVIDDIIGILILAVVTSVGDGGAGNLLLHHGKTVVIMMVFIGLTLTVGVWTVHRIDKALQERRKARTTRDGKVEFGKRRLVLMSEPMLTVGLLVMLAFAIASHAAGMAMITGAFLGGLLLSETRARNEIFRRVSIVANGIFIPIFFLVTGMGFDPSGFLNAGMFTVMLIVVAVLGKVLGCGIPAKMMGYPGKAVGFAMTPRAEVCLVVALMALNKGIIDKQLYSSLLVMIIVTGLLVPPFIKRYVEQVRHLPVAQPFSRKSAGGD